MGYVLPENLEGSCSKLSRLAIYYERNDSDNDLKKSPKHKTKQKNFSLPRPQDKQELRDECLT